MTVRVSVHARSKRVLIALRNHNTQFDQGIHEALYDIGRITQTEIRRLLDTGPKTGRIYSRPGGRRHRASAPGEAPATDTGALAKSVDYVVQSAIRMEVGDREHYGEYLEDGTRRMRARPHVVRGANNTAGRAVVLLSERVIPRLGIL